MSILYLAVILVLAAPAFCQQYSQRAVLYDQSNGEGNYVVIPQDYVDDLSKIGWDNKVRSVCVTGTWLFYQDAQYNSDGSRGMEYVFGRDNYCVNIRTIAGAISSVRYAGAPRDYRQATFTLFANDYFQGEEEYLLNDASNLNLEGNHKSIIITGGVDWTVYDLPSWQGNSLCLKVPGNDSPAFLTDLQNLDPVIPHGTIRSVRRGCLSANSYTLASLARTNSGPQFTPLLKNLGNIN